MRKLISLDLPFPCHSVLRGSPNYPVQGLMISTPQCSKSLTFLVTIFAPLETAIAAICAVYHITEPPSCSQSFPMHKLFRPDRLSGVQRAACPLLRNSNSATFLTIKHSCQIPQTKTTFPNNSSTFPAGEALRRTTHFLTLSSLNYPGRLLQSRRGFSRSPGRSTDFAQKASFRQMRGSVLFCQPADLHPDFPAQQYRVHTAARCCS